MNSIEKEIFEFDQKLPLTSVCVPVYNQENIIFENLMSIIDNIIGSFELLVALDFCTDKTEQEITRFINSVSCQSVSRIVVFKIKNFPIFEASCDNLLFRESRGRFCLEIQADMKMVQKGFNNELQMPFDKFDNVCAVSGRCVHNMFCPGGIGKLGKDIEKSVDQLKIKRGVFYQGQTVNRGPLMILRDALVKLEYLDDNKYYLDNSDHDFMARAYNEHRMICGYVPIDFESPLRHGSTRSKVKNPINEEAKRQRQAVSGGGQGGKNIDKHRGSAWDLNRNFIERLL